MKELKIVVRNATGLHARPATVFAGTAGKFQSEVRVLYGNRAANAKRPLSLLALGIKAGQHMHVTVEGPDEEQAWAALVELVQGNWAGDAEGQGGSHWNPPSRRQAEDVPWSRRTLRGTGVSPGLVVGPVFHWRAAGTSVNSAADPRLEYERLTAALESVRAELGGIRKRVEARAGLNDAAIFDIHLSVIDDAELLGRVRASIDGGRSAAAAWDAAIESEASAVAAVEDPLLASRAADLRDIGAMVRRELDPAGDSAADRPEVPHIVLADDLTASDVGRMDPALTLGFCTARGTPQSHAAILARSLGIPAVVDIGALPVDEVFEGECILDGDAGMLCVETDRAALSRAREEQRRRIELRASGSGQDAAPAVTRDGRPVGVLANIASAADLRAALAAGADGVGLLRTEFLFLNRPDPPGEEEQFQVFREMMEALDGRAFTVRTLDLGADKTAPFLKTEREHNPALGLRGIRLALAHRDLFHTQLRALARAAERGALRVMFPMIGTIDEWQAARRALADALAMTGVSAQSGLMIEVPAAALLAGHFMADADFVSIGTNDLAQYTLAIDREHPTLAASADGLHPAVLRLVAEVVTAARGTGRRVSVCGELAADADAVSLLVGLGVDELSVGSIAIGAVKARIRRISFSAAENLARRALACENASDVRRLAREESTA